MPNIKEISKMAGCSTATVSNVLNNSVKVSPDMREKVLRVIQETQYRPNSIAKSLKVKKTNIIGVIVEDITVFNAPEIINGIDEYAENLGYHIILNNLRLYKRLGDYYSAPSKYSRLISGTVQILLGRQVDGIIYVGHHSRDVSGIIEEMDLPIVYTYCYSSTKVGHSVNYDDEQAVYDVTEYLIGRGHRNIGVISGLYDSMQSQARFKGYQRALEDRKIFFNPAYLKAGDWGRESGYQLGKELLSTNQRPSAIFAMNDIMAAGVIDAATELGIAIPGDLSLIGFDNRECSRFVLPKLTTVALPLQEMGRQAAKTIVDLISGELADTEAKEIKLQCNLVERCSVADLSGS